MNRYSFKRRRKTYSLSRNAQRSSPLIRRSITMYKAMVQRWSCVENVIGSLYLKGAFYMMPSVFVASIAIDDTDGLALRNGRIGMQIMFPIPVFTFGSHVWAFIFF